MNAQKITVRIAEIQDAEAILEIYAPYIRNTAITFEYDVPDIAEFTERIRRTLTRYPYIVAECNGELLGYAYTGAFVGRAACDWSVETSVYIKENQRKRGIGKLLYQALEDISRLQNITNMNACIAYPDKEDEHLTKNSVQFHKHIGYTWVGKFDKCGYKFNQWYHLVWVEKIIHEHTAKPLPFIPFPELEQEKLEAIGIKSIKITETLDKAT
ncbi:MAG: GNAT family N-acetyltransferase [Lachnospiraceae bacterium]|nr:GNAT family N-acetyltransferase [Lachnospiraceae bacterium]